MQGPNLPIHQMLQEALWPRDETEDAVQSTAQLVSEPRRYKSRCDQWKAESQKPEVTSITKRQKYKQREEKEI